ncbi:trypsin-like peptidase domain-containing protein [Streptomyces fradiae]|uniref:trypsin-like peptidase domain-containing protein n=1 Tax=Streptomyces fradiae TaxID=1906 RepID=UPI0039880B9D
MPSAPSSAAHPSLKTPPWAVRIRWGNGEIAGAGVLLSPDRVLTCAHVVTPGAPVTAEFVGAAGGRTPDGRVPAVTARVDEEGYVPETLDADQDPRGDVALLRLDHPRPAHEPVTLHRLSAPNRTVRMYGFPRDHNGGVWFRATIVGGWGRDGQVQLFPATPGEVAAPGCSGAGVVDDRTGAVIGIVLTSVEDRLGNAFSSMSPAETIVQHLPRVAAWTRGRTAVDDRLRSRTGSGRPRPDLDEPFALRLATWLRGDGDQVKISVVRPADRVRAETLRRAVTLADRELRTAASVDRASLDPPGTVPSAGGHDLALDVTGATAADTAERVAERMGLWQHPAAPAVERIRTGGVALTLVVDGVDRAADPPALLDLLAVLRRGGSRLLLVFREPGPLYERARAELVIGPDRERRERLAARLRELTGPLAASLGDAMAAVRADDPEPVRDALYRAGLALHLLTGAQQRRESAQSGHGTAGAPGAQAPPSRSPSPTAPARGPAAPPPSAPAAPAGPAIPADPADPATPAHAPAHAHAPAPSAPVDLAAYERLADRLEARLRAAADRLDALRHRRAELVGRLDGYHALHRSLTEGAEDLDADALHRRAHRLLRTRPCDVPAAEEAVAAYTDLVERADGSRRDRPAQDRSGPAQGRPAQDRPAQDRHGQPARHVEPARPAGPARPVQPVEPAQRAGEDQGGGGAAPS